MVEANKPAKRSKASFTEDERAAMQERAGELKSEGRRKAASADTEGEVLAKIAEFPEPDRRLAERVHALVRAAAPSLVPKLWYGMPAYAQEGKVVCFFQNASKFKTRYSTLGFSDLARLDDGNMWPNSFALLDLGPADEARITELVRRATA